MIARCGVGFLGIHDGRGANFGFVDWWADENELHHHVYISPAEQTQQLRPASPADAQACVWDLCAMSFERRAWLEAMLINSAGGDCEAYLLRRLNTET